MMPSIQRHSFPQQVWVSGRKTVPLDRLQQKPAPFPLIPMETSLGVVLNLDSVVNTVGATHPHLTNPEMR